MADNILNVLIFFPTEASSFHHWITRLLNLKPFYIGNPYASMKDAIICWCQLLALIHFGPLQLIVKAFYNGVQNMTSIPVNWWLTPSSLYFLGTEKVPSFSHFRHKKRGWKWSCWQRGQTLTLPSPSRSIYGYSLSASIKDCQVFKWVSFSLREISGFSFRQWQEIFLLRVRYYGTEPSYLHNSTGRVSFNLGPVGSCQLHDIYSS